MVLHHHVPVSRTTRLSAMVRSRLPVGLAVPDAAILGAIEMCTADSLEAIEDGRMGPLADLIARRVRTLGV